jgi:hypothetical protein
MENDSIAKLTLLSSNHSNFLQCERVRFYLEHLLNSKSLVVKESLPTDLQNHGTNDVAIPLIAITNKSLIMHSTPKVIHDIFGDTFVSASHSSATNQHNKNLLISNQTKITTSTQINVIYTKYRVVFSLDVSPSMATLNCLTGEIPFDHIFAILRNLIDCLCKPIPVGSFVVKKFFVYLIYFILLFYFLILFILFVLFYFIFVLYLF